MTTYFRRKIIIDDKEVVRNVRMIGEIAAIRYKRCMEHVVCSGNPNDKTAKWKVIFGGKWTL